MKKSRFPESQVVAMLKEGEAGVAVAQLTRKYGISAAPYYHWKSKYAGAGILKLKQLRAT
jgi:putative transposase